MFSLTIKGVFLIILNSLCKCVGGRARSTESDPHKTESSPEPKKINKQLKKKITPNLAFVERLDHKIKTIHLKGWGVLHIIPNII